MNIRNGRFWCFSVRYLSNLIIYYDSYIQINYVILFLIVLFHTVVIAAATTSAEKRNYTDASGYKCISIEFSARINALTILEGIYFELFSNCSCYFKFFGIILERIAIATYQIPLNSSKVIAGSCGGDIQNISIEWKDKNHRNNMTLSFNFDQLEKTYSLSKIMIILSGELLFGGNHDTSIHLFYKGYDLETSTNSSYYSKKEQSLPLTNIHHLYVGTLDLSNIWFEVHNKIPLCKINQTKHRKDTNVLRSNCCLNQIFFWFIKWNQAKYRF